MTTNCTSNLIIRVITLALISNVMKITQLSMEDDALDAVVLLHF